MILLLSLQNPILGSKKNSLWDFQRIVDGLLLWNIMANFISLIRMCCDDVKMCDAGTAKKTLTYSLFLSHTHTHTENYRNMVNNGFGISRLIKIRSMFKVVVREWNGRVVDACKLFEINNRISNYIHRRKQQTYRNSSSSVSNNVRRLIIWWSLRFHLWEGKFRDLN